MLDTLLAILLGVAVGIGFLLLRRERRRRLASEKELLRSEEMATGHVASIDRLVGMLATLHDFGRAASGIKSRQDLAKSIVDSAVKLMGTEMGSLMLTEKATQELVIVSSRGLSDEVIKATRLKVGEGIAGLVAKEGKPIFVEDIETDIRFRAAPVRYDTKSFIAVPLRIKGRVIGVLNVNRQEESPPFSERDVKLLSLLADQAAVTIENLELYQNLEQLYLQAMRTLAQAVDVREGYAPDRAERSAKLARAVAEEMHLPAAMIKQIEYAAIIHDIGKIGVPEEVLKKPGKLSPEERTEAMKHPAIASKMLDHVEFLAPVAPLILYHHEWFDGSGYGEGLAGEEIPIGARIVAVIDVFNALTSDRPYRKALSQGEAIAELRKSSGTQFDPKVVEVFVRVVEQISREKQKAQAS